MGHSGGIASKALVTIGESGVHNGLVWSSPLEGKTMANRHQRRRRKALRDALREYRREAAKAIAEKRDIVHRNLSKGAERREAKRALWESRLYGRSCCDMVRSNAGPYLTKGLDIAASFRQKGGYTVKP